MAKSPSTKEYQSFASRLHTFQTAHQLSKRRASTQTSKRKGAAGNTVEWPHERPSGEDLARAGFFYRPAQDSNDNVQCFLCSVKLDGWEPEDDPLKEHLAHSGGCTWATSVQAGFLAQQAAEEGNSDDVQDPMSEELIGARRATFDTGVGWPHEGKRGWKCKITKMVDAGWCSDPAPGAEGEEEEADGVTCFYCNLSLDGWEPKDDPMEEHRRRSPGCAFFALVEKFGSGPGNKKATTKGKGKKGLARTSTASKGSRLSTQSAMSTFSQEPSLADVGGVEMGNWEAVGTDDSITSTATAASQATATGTTKGKKKGGRPKAAAKGAKGRKRANTVESEADNEAVYPDLSSQMQSQSQPAQPEEEIAVSPAELMEIPAPAPAKKGRKGTRQSKQAQVDSSVMEVSSFDVAPAAKKATRGRKAKVQPEPETEQEADGEHSDVSAQLQEELERSMSLNMDDEVGMESTPKPEPPQAKRGTKRTSDGLEKKERREDSEVENVIVEFPVPPKPAPAAKGKRGRPSKQVQVESDVEAPSQVPGSSQIDAQTSEAEAERPKTTKAKKAASAKGKGRGKKASSTRSSRSSRATVMAEAEQERNEPEDLERDEREIEAELERIAAEQAVQAEQEKTAEFEPSPSQKQMQHLENEVRAESRRGSTRVVEEVAGSPPQLPPLNVTANNATPSPSGSDKENQPSSIVHPSITKHQAIAPALTLSPTKTTRIPLAPGTPNRTLLSPSKRLQLSPSKQLSRLTSTVPWEPVDLDTVLLASPQPTPGTLASRLAGAAGALESPEKGLTVEAWIRQRAEKAEEQLRRRCEEMVGGFEREGVRALGTLNGIVAN